jgi:hypothetical protein
MNNSQNGNIFLLRRIDKLRKLIRDVSYPQELYLIVQICDYFDKIAQFLKRTTSFCQIKMNDCGSAAAL